MASRSSGEVVVQLPAFRIVRPRGPRDRASRRDCGSIGRARALPSTCHLASLVFDHAFDDVSGHCSPLYRYLTLLLCRKPFASASFPRPVATVDRKKIQPDRSMWTSGQYIRTPLQLVDPPIDRVWTPHSTNKTQQPEFQPPRYWGRYLVAGGKWQGPRQLE